MSAAGQRMAFVDLRAQHAEVAGEVAEGMARVLAATSFVGGPDVAEFERAWAAFCGLRRAVGVANGTDALELALRAVGVGPGDEVVVPANSFIASAGAVGRIGATPVFVDCDAEYLLMDPERVAAAITPRTRAVMPVHLYGQMAPMDQIAAVAAEAGVAVVEDGAQAHGATQRGHRMGHWGAAVATSFYPGKNLGAYGDAGAVATDDPAVATAIEGLRNHGSLVRYEHPSLGFNSRLDTLQAVVLNAKLARLDEWNERRAAAAAAYCAALSGIPGLRLPATLEGNTHVWHLFVVRVEARDAVLAHLGEHGIPAAIHYPTALHLTGAFASLGYHRGDFPVAEEACRTILSLPLHPHLTPDHQDRVIASLRSALGR